MKKRQEERDRELLEMHQLDQAERDTQDREGEPDNKDPDYFMTQVEQEDASKPTEEDPFDDQVVEEEKSRPQSNNSSAINHKISYRPPSYQKRKQKEGIPFFAMNPYGSESKAQSAYSRDLINKNLADRIGPKALLQIDHRWNCVPKYGEPLDDKEHLKRIFTFDGALKGRKRPFIPSLRTKKHPQLAKIEAYFKDCNPEYIPKTPLIKIPTLFELENQHHMLQDNNQNRNLFFEKAGTQGFGNSSQISYAQSGPHQYSTGFPNNPNLMQGNLRNFENPIKQAYIDSGYPM